MSFAQNIIKEIYGTSTELDAPENNNEHFRAGYNQGLKPEERCQEHPIITEYRRIGCPAEIPDSFKEWKRGYNTARIVALT